ncbi:MAG: hypothetical protein ACREQ5_01050 [Candidatus Dormibacteria bacterium]
MDEDVNLATVRADDVLMDQVGHGEQPDGDELTRVLVGWRVEVHAAPVPELVDTATATRVVWAGRLTSS